MLNHVKVNIYYDIGLQKITGKAEEPAIISENLLFVYFLNFIFSSHPDITKKYPPGTLGFTINSMPPLDTYIMQDRDELKLMSFKKL